MEVNYLRDLHNSYLVLPKSDDSSEESYCVHMLQANIIEGIIKPKARIIDNRTLYYYNITSKQSIETIYVKNTINYEQIKKLLLNLTSIIEQAHEFLLSENDMVLRPEHIYIDLSTGQVNICYLPGYNKDIRRQIADLVEYIMNKLEYNDKEAVFYVYNIYAVCRDESFLFDDFLLAVKESKADSSIKLNNKKSINQEIKKLNKLETDYNKDIAEAISLEQSRRKQIPIMMEKISDDREQYYYPLRTYIYTGVCVGIGILLPAIGINTKILYKSIGNRIDYGKLMALILILVCAIGYLMKYIWNKNNRITRIISKDEYIDPRVDYKVKIEEEKSKQGKVADEYTLPKNKPEIISKPEDRPNSTVLLYAESPSSGCCLEPKNKNLYEMIQIRSFPYVIGKQKDNVDYFLDNEAVSRYHVKITREEDIFYITDLNSTNGTKLNEIPLPCYQRYEIRKDDKVEIAGIKYLFKV